MLEKEKSNLEQSDNIIKRHVLFAMGAGLIPVPLIDIVAVATIQRDMLKQLCKQYGQDYNDTSGKALVSTLTGTTLARLTAGKVGSIMKSIPLIGSVLGGVTLASFAGATTYAIGQVVANHFASGGSIIEFNEDHLKVFYKQQLEKGKKVVKEWNQEAATEEEEYEIVTEKQAPIKTTTSLEKATALLKSGLLTEKEFNRVKKRILKEEKE